VFRKPFEADSAVSLGQCEVLIVFFFGREGGGAISFQALGV